MKLNKLTIIEIIVVLLAFIALIVYISPKFINKKEEMTLSKIKAQSAVFTSCVLEEFSKNFKIKPSEVAQNVVDKLNKTEKNPYDKKQDAFTFAPNCKACNSVEYDNDLRMVILTTYDKEGELVARSVVKPPSYVTYFREESKDKSKVKEESKIEIIDEN